jgi:hypothetical protein
MIDVVKTLTLNGIQVPISGERNLPDYSYLFHEVRMNHLAF